MSQFHRTRSGGDAEPESLVEPDDVRVQNRERLTTTMRLIQELGDQLSTKALAAMGQVDTDVDECRRGRVDSARQADVDHVGRERGQDLAALEDRQRTSSVNLARM